MTFIADGDVFKPQTIGEIIRDMVYEKLAILNTPAIRPMQAKFINGGRQVTIPVFSGVNGDFETLDPDDKTATDPAVNDATMSFETVDVVSKIFDVGIKGCTLDDAYKSGDFNLIDEVLDDVANKAAKLVDLYLIALAEASTLEYDITGATTKTLNRSAIIKAKTTKWGDMASTPSFLVVHSTPFGDVVDEVKDYNVYGPASQAVNEQMVLPRLFGSPIIVSDQITSSGGATPKFTNLILGDGAIDFQFARELDYKVIAQVGDRYVHEFVVRYIGKLRRRNGKALAIKLVTN